MLNCPHCHHALVHCQNEFGNFWHCGSCDGTAITVSLLRKFVDEKTVNRLWQGSRQNDYPRQCECPGCQNGMEVVPLELPVGLRHIDVCERCQFIWLDAGEWDDLPTPAIPKVKADPVRQASPALREKIALERIQQMEARSDRAPGTADLDWWQWFPALLQMPVEEDQPTFGNKAPVTWGLALLILLTAVLTFPNLGEYIRDYGLIPADALRLGGFSFISAFFLHGGFLHLIGNLYFLLIFGDNVEHYLGMLRFLLLVAVAAFAGDCLHILIYPESQLPCIGASGGISGIMAYYALKFPKARISLLLFYIPGAWLRLGARWMFLLWVAQQCLIIWQQANGIGHVSGAAHIGGALVGVLAYILSKLTDPNESTRGSIFER